ncbi:DUF547 domain-containing protein [Hymenobacter lucidus]|uniref:DUF547 domain-containing protein n=1 Tax=Hymenobacter lucidus TaxID=2880930 RepID=A0ABS8AWU5_9BACT|nr:DUF547 domain-containing protein [Hymenobacter lucidus]MCB2410269.1 DUF547 domain-containing protein [Hymenobacter lucidus]
MFGFMRVAGLALALLILTGNSAAVAQARPAAPDINSFVAAANGFLRQYVGPEGNVNYRAIKSRPAALKGLLEQVRTMKTQMLPAAGQKAFYLNAYNLLVIGAVVEKYPLTSVMKLPGFFDKQQRLVAGEQMTLNELETNKLRKPYNDPRVHFALVCAAQGCPQLSPEAYAPTTVEAQLTTQARRVLQNSQFIRVDNSTKKVLLSEIFHWYEADFKATGKSTVAYINQFRGEQPIPASFVIGYYDYNWALNDGSR